MKTLNSSKLLKHDKYNLLFWIIGFIAFIWIVLRTGTNPKRFAYPCQKAAYPLASAWVTAIIGIVAGISLTNKKTRKYIAFAFVFISIVGFGVTQVPFNKSYEMGSLPVWDSSDNTVSEVFIYDNIPPTTGSLSAGNETVPDTHLSDPGIDSLIRIMKIKGLFLHKTLLNSNGIVGNDDIVIIKPNFQWRNRMGTNTDRIKGIIWQVLNHPDGFTGEILICENTQKQIWESSSSYYFGGYNDRSNNSDDLNQSIVDVVNTFISKGYPVSYYSWDNLNTNTVSDYGDGDMNDGYVYNSSDHTSYPKFQTPAGSYVSLQNGIWNSGTNSYSTDKLTIINMPVLKAHGLAGATIALKNYIGCMNVTKSSEWYNADNNSFHDNYCFTEYALVARELNVCWPKLNIIDATWVAPQNNYNHGQTSVNAKTVIASTDPVAASWYASKHVMKNLADNWSSRVDPDNPSGVYGKNFNHWYNFLVNNTTRVVTKTESEISVFGKEVLGTDPTTIDNNPSDFKIKIFPNPSNGIVNIETEKDITVRITSITGKFILEENTRNKSLRIPKTLNPGVYIIQILDNNRMIHSQKLIVN